MSDEILEARTLLESNGFVVLREQSYRRAQERQRIAGVLQENAERERDSFAEWARKCCEEERTIRDRLTLVVALATQHGMTTDDLIDMNRKIDAASAPLESRQEGTDE